MEDRYRKLNEKCVGLRIQLDNVSAEFAEFQVILSVSYISIYKLVMRRAVDCLI